MANGRKAPSGQVYVRSLAFRGASPSTLSNVRVASQLRQRGRESECFEPGVTVDCVFTNSRSGRVELLPLEDSLVIAPQVVVHTLLKTVRRLIPFSPKS